MRITQTGYWESDDKLYHVRCEGLFNWIVDYLSPQKNKQLYDFGCGLGHYLKPLSNAGFTKLTGFEGKVPLYKEFENIISQDLSVSFSVPEKGNCICLEVGEHIPAQFENIFIDNITNACDDNLIMSWAVRGQQGEGHVNCLNNDEVIPKIVERGFKFLTDETLSARKNVGDQYPWFQNTTLIFKRI